MGRGRQKTKHTKVARELKYFSPDTNYNALEKELGHPSSDPRLSEDLAAWPEYVEPPAYEDKYAVDEDDDESDDDADEDTDEVARNKTA